MGAFLDPTAFNMLPFRNCLPSTTLTDCSLTGQAGSCCLWQSIPFASSNPQTASGYDT